MRNWNRSLYAIVFSLSFAGLTHADDVAGLRAESTVAKPHSCKTFLPSAILGKMLPWVNA